MVPNSLPAQRHDMDMSEGSQDEGLCGGQVAAGGSELCFYLHKGRHCPKHVRKRKQGGKKGKGQRGGRAERALATEPEARGDLLRQLPLG